MRHMERFVVAERIVAHGAVIERSEVADVNEILIDSLFRQFGPGLRMTFIVGIVGRRGRKLRQHEHLRLTAEKFEFDGRRTFPAPGIRRVIDVQDIADVRTLYGALLHEDRRIVEPERAPSTSVLDFGTPSGADRSLNLYGGRTSAAPTVEEVRHTAEPEKSSVSSPQATTESAIIVRNSHFHPFSQYLNIDIIGKL